MLIGAQAWLNHREWTAEWTTMAFRDDPMNGPRWLLAFAINRQELKVVEVSPDVLTYGGDGRSEAQAPFDSGELSCRKIQGQYGEAPPRASRIEIPIQRGKC